MIWPFRSHRPGDSDPEAFLAELAASHPGKSYAKMDKHREFRRLFLDSEPGRRVLYEIMALCGMYKSAAPRAGFNPYQTMFFNGQQDIAFNLLAIMNVEPRERPTNTKEK